MRARASQDYRGVWSNRAFASPPITPRAPRQELTRSRMLFAYGTRIFFVAHICCTRPPIGTSSAKQKRNRACGRSVNNVCNSHVPPTRCLTLNVTSARRCASTAAPTPSVPVARREFFFGRGSIGKNNTNAPGLPYHFHFIYTVMNKRSND